MIQHSLGWITPTALQIRWSIKCWMSHAALIFVVVNMNITVIPNISSQLLRLWIIRNSHHQQTAGLATRLLKQWKPSATVTSVVYPCAKHAWSNNDLFWMRKLLSSEGKYAWYATGNSTSGIYCNQLWILLKLINSLSRIYKDKQRRQSKIAKNKMRNLSSTSNIRKKKKVICKLKKIK